MVTMASVPQAVRNQLAAELADVKAAHPEWSCFLSDELRCWAARAYKHGGAITLDANSPALLDEVITAWVSGRQPRHLIAIAGGQ